MDQKEIVTAVLITHQSSKTETDTVDPPWTSQDKIVPIYKKSCAIREVFGVEQEKSEEKFPVDPGCKVLKVHQLQSQSLNQGSHNLSSHYPQTLVIKLCPFTSANSANSSQT